MISHRALISPTPKWISRYTRVNKDRHGVNNTPGGTHLQQRSQGYSVKDRMSGKPDLASTLLCPRGVDWSLKRAGQCGNMEARLELELRWPSKVPFPLPMDLGLYLVHVGKGEQWTPRKLQSCPLGPLKIKGERGNSQHSLLLHQSSSTWLRFNLTVNVWFDWKKVFYVRFFKWVHRYND